MKSLHESKHSLLDRVFGYLDRRSASDRLILLSAVILCISAGIWTLFVLSSNSSVSVPGSGGTLTEGIVGTPRFVNPVLAITRADHDIGALVYSGLMRATKDGTLAPDLAESVTISDDGNVYAIVLRDDISFHDGTPVTTEDVAFTVNLIQDPELKSPLRGSWSDVDVEIISPREMNFVLKDAYVPFIENLTVGILPKHIWNNLTTEELPFSQYNTEPIGSGLYAIDQIERSQAGLISSYVLKSRPYGDRKPLINTILTYFYTNESELKAALNKNEVMATGYLENSTVASLAESGNIEVVEYALPRVFGIFMNQNRSAILRDEAVRQALSVSIDRDALIDTALEGYGQPTHDPIPSGFNLLESSATTTSTTDTLSEQGRAILEAGGWQDDGAGGWVKDIDGTELPLAITLTTANSEIFESSAAYIAEAWRLLGVDVNVALFEQADLVQAVIRPRDYELLLFGTDVGRTIDLYPFWHSSQREDPGLNISLYTNITADQLLEDYRVSQSESDRQELLQAFVEEMQTDNPAIFLFNPSFLYVIKNAVTTVPIKTMTKPSERFSTIEEWYLHEERLWPFFTD